MQLELRRGQFEWNGLGDLGVDSLPAHSTLLDDRILSKLLRHETYVVHDQNQEFAAKEGLDLLPRLAISLASAVLQLNVDLPSLSCTEVTLDVHTIWVGT